MSIYLSGLGGSVISNITNVSNIYPTIDDHDAWNIATAYVAEDIVGHEGSVYICLTPDTGTEPGSDATVWQLIANEAQLSANELIDEYSVGTTVNLTTDELYRTAKSTAANTFNLPASAGLSVGNWLKVWKGSADAVTIAADGTDTITWPGDGGTPAASIADSTSSVHSFVYLLYAGSGSWEARINGNFA